MTAQVLKRPWDASLPSPKGALKFISFVGLLILFIIHHAFTWILIRDEKRRNTYFLGSVSKYAAIAQWLLRIKVSHSGSRAVEGSLIVANHLSYIDVLVLAVLYPSLFITSVEMKETFFLGQVTTLAGCFFVERRPSKVHPGRKEKELNEIRTMLAHGFNVFFFPEGTSTDGNKVLPFKPRFFQLAVDLAIPVVPIVIKYQGLAHRIVPWYGSMTFVDHLYRVCRLNEIEVEVTELSPVFGNDKLLLSKLTHNLISENYG